MFKNSNRVLETPVVLQLFFQQFLQRGRTLSPFFLRTTRIAIAPFFLKQHSTPFALAVFMTPGLAFFYGGLVDHKNIIATMMQSFICLGVVGVLWIVVGFSLAFGSDCGQAFCYPMHLYSSFFWRHQGFMCQGKKKRQHKTSL